MIVKDGERNGPLPTTRSDNDNDDDDDDDCKVSFLANGGCGLRSHHQSGCTKSALDVPVVFSSPAEGVSRYGEHTEANRYNTERTVGRLGTHTRTRVGLM